jgi:type I restriction enzyme M protein
MLDKETRNRIDELRQILVGKVTDPRSQVEQITNGMLYKFMDDMDQESISMGGVPSYFTNTYEKFAWKNLIDSKNTGNEKVNLYSEALEKMYFNESLPETFREIFKNSTLPYKDPQVFNKFITRINDFKYSNSESLGDAFEYLLSFMGKQGEAGQFRTPRHIIDFVVDIIEPSKNDKILDPSSGTAGFLISAYKYILKQNTKSKLGDLLNSTDRKKISENLNGYDISPEFLKVSLMNMFLHGFKNPNIFEYDTLSSEEKWNQYFDIVLANPPFFTPKGGITPHNRFGVKSKRAEVLFVDYINEHLKPKGKAGLIVPEGIIFRDRGGYKTLREKLIKTSLVGIISLPQGIFEPYSGVKTSIIILDKQLYKKQDFIYFIDAKNDGYSLTKNRIPIEDNDLPIIKNTILNNKFDKNKIVKKILRKEIKDFNIREHLTDIVDFEENSSFKKISEIATISSGNSAPQNKSYFENGKYPFIRTSDVGKIKIGSIKETRDYLNDEGIVKLKKFKKGTILFPKSGASTLLNHRVIMKIDGYVSSHLATIKANEEIITDEYLFYMLQNIDAHEIVPNPSYPSINLPEIGEIEIPLKDINYQNEIVSELNGYQKIIDGAQTIIDNYRPKIEMDSSWKIEKLGKVCDVRDGTHDSPKYVIKGYPLITSKNVINGEISFEKVNYISKEDLVKINKRSKVDKGDVLMPMIGTIGRPTVVDFNKEFAIKNVALVKCNKEIKSDYIQLVLESILFLNYIKKNIKGTNQKFIALGDLRNFEIPVPDLDTQNEIVSNYQNEKLLIRKNADLIKMFNEKKEEVIQTLFKL